MPTGSDSDKATKYLGIIASVIGILAFFGISNWEELTGDVSSSSIGRGDCITGFEFNLDNAIYDEKPVSCDDSEAVWEVLGRFPYDPTAHEELRGVEVLTEGYAKRVNPMATCAIKLGQGSAHQAVSIVESEVRDVLCLKGLDS